MLEAHSVIRCMDGGFEAIIKKRVCNPLGFLFTTVRKTSNIK